MRAATPVGTPPNLIAIEVIREQLGVEITFFQWMLFSVPIVLVLLAIVLAYLSWVGPTGVRKLPGLEPVIAASTCPLGPLRRGDVNAC